MGNDGTRVWMFDFDGVIVDSLELFSASLLTLCRERGLAKPATQEELLRLFDTNMYDGLSAAGLPAADHAAFAGQLGERQADGLMSCRPFPGVRAALARLATRGPVVIVTSNLTAVVQAWLRRHGVGCVKDVLGADRGTGKVAKIRSVLCGYPHSAVGYYVGDTSGDMVEARAAGVRAVAVTWGWHPATALVAAEPDFVVKTPAELGALAGGSEDDQ